MIVELGLEGIDICQAYTIETNLDSHVSRAKGLSGLITTMLKTRVFIAIQRRGEF